MAPGVCPHPQTDRNGDHQRQNVRGRLPLHVAPPSSPIWRPESESLSEGAIRLSKGLLVTALPVVRRVDTLCSPTLPPRALPAKGPTFSNFQLDTAFIGEGRPNTTVACTNGAAEAA